MAICLWLAVTYDEHKWRRVLFSLGAAVCALMFALLAYTSKKRIDQSVLQRLKQAMEMLDRKKKHARTSSIKKHAQKHPVQQNMQSEIFFSPPVPEPLPDLSQRRSTIGGRCSKKSISTAGSGEHAHHQPPAQAHGQPTQVETSSSVHRSVRFRPPHRLPGYRGGIVKL